MKYKGEDMRKYISFFRLRFSTGLQYRSAALAGIVTQFIWGAMEILVFRAFYKADASAFPMELHALSSYIWMQQAFLALYMTWFLENEIFDSIKNGNISYELCRPINIYNMWFVRSVANRLSRAVLRCMPILIFASFLPAPFGLSLPKDLNSFLWFLITMLLGFLVVVAFCMLIYIVTFFTISPQGVRMVAVSMIELFAGSVIPLPFLPDGIRQVFELLPFASMQNVPLRIYSSDIAGKVIYTSAGLQLFWLITLILVGKMLTNKALKKVEIQGG
ncbi:MAG: transporter permease [Clostridiales bacterium]|jgi:ABC-2 type transport system permease protein|nr:transporter permease [Clostridiales bacterium]